MIGGAVGVLLFVSLCAVREEVRFSRMVPTHSQYAWGINRDWKLS